MNSCISRPMGVKPNGPSPFPGVVSGWRLKEIPDFHCQVRAILHDNRLKGSKEAKTILEENERFNAVEELSIPFQVVFFSLPNSCSLQYAKRKWAMLNEIFKYLHVQIYDIQPYILWYGTSSGSVHASQRFTMGRPMPHAPYGWCMVKGTRNNAHMCNLW